MKCKYCGKEAGFLRFKHPECEARHTSALEKLSAFYGENYFISHDEFSNAGTDVEKVIADGMVSGEEVAAIIKKTIWGLMESSHSLPFEDCQAFSSAFSSIPTSVQDELLNERRFVFGWYETISSLINANPDNNDIISGVHEIIHRLGLNRSNLFNEYSVGLVEDLINGFLDDSVIDDEEEARLAVIMSALYVSEDDMRDSSTFQKVIQSRIIRNLQAGTMVETPFSGESFPVLIGKKENVFWCYDNIECLEEKTGSKIVGGSRGVSLRICKGVYYRVGNAKGTAVKYEYTESIGKGLLVITDKNIIFSGEKSIKIPLAKLISYTPYRNGLTLQKDGVRAKPVTFIGFDPWFAINLITVLYDE